MRLHHVGGLVHWPTPDGWQCGTVVRIDPHVLPDGRDSLRFTIKVSGTGHIVTRDIRGCAGHHPGPHVVPSPAPPAT